MILVEISQACYKFASALETAMPLVEKLLFSVTVGDAIESCCLLGTALQFNVQGAEKGLRQALFQIFYRDQSVVKNVALVYKDIYLTMDPNQTERQNAISIARKLIDLVRELVDDQVRALAHMLAVWREEKDISNEVIKVNAFLRTPTMIRTNRNCINSFALGVVGNILHENAQRDRKRQQNIPDAVDAHSEKRNENNFLEFGDSDQSWPRISTGN